MNLAIYHSNHVKKLLKHKADLAIAFDTKTQNLLENNKIKTRQLNNYLSSKELAIIDRDAWFLLDKVRKIKIKNKTLDRIFTYNNIPLLDTLQWEFYFYYFKRILTYIKALKNIIKKTRPKQISYVDDNSMFCRILEQVTKNIKLKRVKPHIHHVLKNELLKIKNMHTFELFISKPGVVRATYAAAFYKRKLIRRIAGYRHRPGKKILFFPNVNNQVEAFETVYRALNKMPRVSAKIINVDDPLDRVKKKLDSRALAYRSFEDYAPLHLRFLAERNLSSIKKKWRKVLNARINFSYDKVQLGNILKEIISYLLFKRKRFNDVVEYIETINNIIEIEEPYALVNIAEYVPLGRALVYCARNHNIKSVNIPHAMLWHQIENSKVHSDMIIVPGKLSKRFLLQAKNSPKKLRVTGFPKLDILHNRKYHDAKVYAQLGLKKNQRFFTLATNPVSNEENTALITSVIEAMKNFPNTKLVIKLHPLESGALQRKLAKELNYDAIIIKDIDIFELIHASELLLVYYSTVAVDAVIMKKPVLTINLSKKPDRLPYAKMGIAYGVYKKQDLPTAINKVLTDPKVKAKLEKSRERFIKEYFFRIDGNSGKRAAKAILSLK